MQKVAKDVMALEGKTGLKPINEAIILGNSKKAAEYISKEKELDPKTVGFAFAYGDSVVLDAIYKKGFDINTTDTIGNSLLGIAASTGNMEALKRLVGTVDINKGTYNITPLEWAVWNNHLEAAKYLISSGAQIRVASFADKDVLAEASKNGNLDMVKLLVESGYPKEGYQRGFITAAESGQLDAVKFYIEKGIDINGKYSEKTALWNAAIRGELEVVEYLVSMGAAINTPDNVDSPLAIACFGNEYEVAKFLLEQGADPNGNMSELSETRPLGSAILKGSFDIVKLLLDYGAVVDDSILKNAEFAGSTGIKEYISQKLIEQTNNK